MTATTRRVSTVSDLPDEALTCAAIGRHIGFLSNIHIAKESSGMWGEHVDARRVTYTCGCTREKVEVIDWHTKRVISRSAAYSGGTLTYEMAGQAEAKAEALAREEARQAGAPLLVNRRDRVRTDAG